jgi:hypothetical protein
MAHERATGARPWSAQHSVVPPSWRPSRRGPGVPTLRVVQIGESINRFTENLASRSRQGPAGGRVSLVAPSPPAARSLRLRRRRLRILSWSRGTDDDRRATWKPCNRLGASVGQPRRNRSVRIYDRAAGIGLDSGRRRTPGLWPGSRRRDRRRSLGLRLGTNLRISRRRSRGWQLGYTRLISSGRTPRLRLGSVRHTSRGSTAGLGLG